MSDDINRTQVGWCTSSRSTDTGGQCVEAGPVNDSSNRVAVRHSHHPADRMLAYTHAEWETFIDDIKAGTFDFSS